MAALCSVAWLACGAVAAAASDVIKHLNSGLVFQPTGSAPYQGLQYAAEDRYSMQFTLVEDIREGAEEDTYILQSSTGYCVDTQTGAFEADVALSFKPSDRYCASWKIDPASTASTSICASGTNLCISSDTIEAMSPSTPVVLKAQELRGSGPKFSLPSTP
mmetsp:Transcript_33275/g.84199  ORF Transcript_33275/g.84199 Transcript_33275/m.84199 type:complete len:161 (+) Transcript_33275:58-540(+)